MSWKIVYAQSSSGKKWVQHFLDTLHPALLSKVIKQLQKISQAGPHIGPPITKKIGHHLYELRLVGKQPIRILFTVTENKIVLLHGFIKKTSKLANKDNGFFLKSKKVN